MTDDVSSTVDPLETSPAPRSGLQLVSAALALPVVSGLALCITTSPIIAYSISIGTVVATAALLAIDTAYLAEVDRHGKKRPHPWLVFLGTIGIWMLCFPLVFQRRRAFVSPNLLPFAIPVTIFFLGAPLAAYSLIPAQLPTPESSEAVTLLEQVIRGSAFEIDPISIDGHRETSFDTQSQFRLCECTVHSSSGTAIVKYRIEWQERKKRLFKITLTEVPLPACTSTMVKQLIEKILRETPLDATLVSIDGHREVSYDSEKQVRYGDCVAHTNMGDLKILFVVEWIAKDELKAQVRAQVTPEPPASQPSP